MTDTNPVPIGTPPKTKPSPKVVMAAVLAFVAPAVIAALTYIQDAGVEIIGISNPILGTLVTGLIVSALTFLAGYVKRDPIRESGARRALGEGGYDLRN